MTTTLGHIPQQDASISTVEPQRGVRISASVTTPLSGMRNQPDQSGRYYY
ncbi:MAG: hypothetical protein KME08_04910 [Aphanothece sp. CMT-3BRIN-NPC111]|nr:hypothetical protein [Aphanothece sp. CMT-3BRIN-NPC111]